MKGFVAPMLVAVLMTSSSEASAQARWEPGWTPVGTPDAVVMSAFGAIAITSEIFGGPKDPRWDREVLLDLPLRKAIGGETTAGEHRAALVSDVSVAVLMAAPLIDAGVAGYVVHRDAKLATNFGLISLESFALTFGVTNLTKVLVGRARPAVAECFRRQQADPDAECARRPNVSFFSGHSAASFTGAGLVCAFGTLTPLHGDGLLGQVPCVSALTLAATTAVLRVMANKHHLSDVVVGSVAGLLSGWLFPTLRFASR